MDTTEAIELAANNDMDLVLMSDKSQPPVCKIINYSKLKYERDKKEKATKSAKSPETKEIKFGYGIMEHDIQVKANNAKKILAKGDKVKVCMQFKGREQTYIDTGIKTIHHFIDLVGNVAILSGNIKRENNQVYVLLTPKQ